MIAIMRARASFAMHAVQPSRETAARTVCSQPQESRMAWDRGVWRRVPAPGCVCDNGTAMLRNKICILLACVHLLITLGLGYCVNVMHTTHRKTLERYEFLVQAERTARINGLSSLEKRVRELEDDLSFAAPLPPGEKIK